MHNRRNKKTAAWFCLSTDDVSDANPATFVSAEWMWTWLLRFYKTAKGGRKQKVFPWTWLTLCVSSQLVWTPTEAQQDGYSTWAKRGFPRVNTVSAQSALCWFTLELENGQKKVFRRNNKTFTVCIFYIGNIRLKRELFISNNKKAVYFYCVCYPASNPTKLNFLCCIKISLWEITTILLWRPHLQIHTFSVGGGGCWSRRAERLSVGEVEDEMRRGRFVKYLVKRHLIQQLNFFFLPISAHDSQ